MVGLTIHDCWKSGSLNPWLRVFLHSDLFSLFAQAFRVETVSNLKCLQSFLLLVSESSTLRATLPAAIVRLPEFVFEPF